MAAWRLVSSRRCFPSASNEAEARPVETEAAAAARLWRSSTERRMPRGREPAAPLPEPVPQPMPVGAAEPRRQRRRSRARRSQPVACPKPSRHAAPPETEPAPREIPAHRASRRAAPEEDAGAGTAARCRSSPHRAPSARSRLKCQSPVESRSSRKPRAQPAKSAGAERLAAGELQPRRPRRQGNRRQEGRAERAEPVKTHRSRRPGQSWFQRLRDGLSRSSQELSGNIAGVFTKRKLDEDTLQDLEDVLIRADLGMETAIRVTDALASSRYGKDVSDAEVRAIMAQEIEKVLTPVAHAAGARPRRTSRMSSWSSASTAPARPRPSASSRPS